MLIKAKSETDSTPAGWKTLNPIDTDTHSGGEIFYCENEFYHVNTICRATDVKDAEGNLIFENDRLKSADYIAANLLIDEEQTNPENFYSNPVVRWVPERSAFYLMSERIVQTAPKIINTNKDIHADYEVDHIRTVRFVALTEDEARHWVVYGNILDNFDDADDFSSDN